MLIKKKEKKKERKEELDQLGHSCDAKDIFPTELSGKLNQYLRELEEDGKRDG